MTDYPHEHQGWFDDLHTVIVDDVPGEPLSDEDREKLKLWWRECGITPPPNGKIVYYSTRFKP